MLKKGELSIRYIILFALGLLVLVVILLIFTGAAKNIITQLKEIWQAIENLKPDFSKLK